MNKLSKGFVFSIIFHLILVVIISRQFSQDPLQTIEKVSPSKPIQARLYFPPAKKEATETLEQQSPVIKKNILTREKIISIPLKEKTTQKSAKKTVETKLSPAALPEPKINNKVLTSDTSSKSIAHSSLKKLQQRLNTQALEYSQNDSFNQYMRGKNTIDPSSTKFNQLPVAKAKIREVDCNASALNTAVTAISGLLGGSIRCNSMPNLKRFLEKRAEERGK